MVKNQLLSTVLYHDELQEVATDSMDISCGKIEVYSTSCTGMMPSESSSACLLSGNRFLHWYGIS